MMQPKGILKLLVDSITGWGQKDPFLHAASLAYYTIFSLAPLLIISTAIAGLIFSQAAVQATIVRLSEEMMGAEVAAFVESILINTSKTHNNSGIIAAIIGLVVLLYGASLVFFRLQISVNVMWDLVPKSDNVQQSALTAVRTGLVAAGSALGVGIYLLSLLLVGALWLNAPTDLLKRILPEVPSLALLITLLLSPIFYTIPFGLLYKTLPKATVRWRDVWPGALLAAVLFWIGSNIIGFYLAWSGFTSIYGASGSLVALLIWIFYSAMVFLYGAKFTQVYADMYGQPVVPERGYMFRPDHMIKIKTVKE